jgi:ParB family transcriptional regulator, chromosome partitioning protein
MLSSGEMPERDGRLLARHGKENPQLGAADLLAYVKEVRAQEALGREEERALLQAMKQRSPAPGVLLSADNHSSSAESAPSRQDPPALLSADNVRPSRSAPSDAVSAPPSMLYADNMQAASAAGIGSPSPAARRTARALVQELGSTPAEQAETLAKGMEPRELESLIEELHAYL